MTNRSQELAALKTHFPNESLERLRWWLEVERGVQALANPPVSLLLSRQDQVRLNKARKEASKHLKYQKSYKISLVGVTGAGKSALTNALLGEYLLQSRSGDATTGTIVTTRVQAATPGMGPSKKATIRYYTLEELSEDVKKYGQALALQGFPKYQNDSSNLIDVERSLRKLDKLAANRSRDHQKMVDDLRDLLTVAANQSAKMETRSEVVDLHSTSDVRRLKELMDEESDLNQDPSRRIIPLIRKIEIEVVKELSEHDTSLTDVELADLPGSQSNLLRHKERRSDQLDPDKNNAFILVLRNDRPGEGITDLVKEIKEVIMGRLETEEQRHHAAQRFFLVVNKGDVRSFDHSGKSIQASVEQVAEAISHNFSSDYEENIFYGVKAPIGLIAYLMQTHPDAAQKWKDGQRSRIFDGLNYKDYHDNIERAKRETSINDDHEAMRQWSGIPAIQQKLHVFLREERFSRDLQAASASYQNALHTVQQTIMKQWQAITGWELGRNPDRQLESYFANRSRNYRKRIHREAEQMVERFRNAYQALHDEQSPSQFALTKELKTVRDRLIGKIEQGTEEPLFQKKLIKGQKTRFITFEIDTRGSLDKLKEFDEQVFKWLEQSASSIAKVMMDELDKQLKQANEENMLLSLRSYWQGADQFDKQYAQLIAKLEEEYTSHCKGSLFSRLKEERVVKQIAAKIPYLGTVVKKKEKELIEQTKREIVAAMRETYQATLDKLIHTLNEPLHDRFIFDSEITFNNFKEIVTEMKLTLSSEITNNNSNLNKHLESLLFPEYTRLEELAKLWAWLNELPLAGRAR